MKTTLLIALAFGSFMQVQAQETWTLQRCLEHAQKNNIQIKQGDLNIRQAQVSKLQSIGATTPNINASGSQMYNFGRNIDPFTNQFIESQNQSQSLNLNGSLTLFQGFQNSMGVYRSTLDLQASLYEQQKLMNDVGLNVVTAYLQVLYNKELLKAAEAQLEGINAQTVRARKLFESGGNSKGALLEAEAQQASEEQRTVLARNQYELSILSLAQLLDLTDWKNFKVEDPMLPTPNIGLISDNPDQIFDFAMGNQPEIKGSEYRLRSAAASINIAHGARSPRLFLNASVGSIYSDRSLDYSISNIGKVPIGLTEDGKLVNTLNDQYIQQAGDVTPYSTQIKNNFNKSVSLTLQIPISNGFQIQSNINRNKISYKRAELDLQQNKNTLYKTIQQSHADANNSLKKFIAAEKTLNAQKESYKYTDQKYQVGLVSFIEFITARNSVFRAEADYLQAKYDFIFKVKILDFYSGKPLQF